MALRKWLMCVAALLILFEKITHANSDDDVYIGGTFTARLSGSSSLLDGFGAFSSSHDAWQPVSTSSGLLTRRGQPFSVARATPKGLGIDVIVFGGDFQYCGGQVAKAVGQFDVGLARFAGFQGQGGVDGTVNGVVNGGSRSDSSVVLFYGKFDRILRPDGSAVAVSRRVALYDFRAQKWRAYGGRVVPPLASALAASDDGSVVLLVAGEVAPYKAYVWVDGAPAQSWLAVGPLPPVFVDEQAAYLRSLVYWRGAAWALLSRNGGAAIARLDNVTATSAERGKAHWSLFHVNVSAVTGEQTNAAAARGNVEWLTMVPGPDGDDDGMVLVSADLLCMWTPPVDVSSADVAAQRCTPIAKLDALEASTRVGAPFVDVSAESIVCVGSFSVLNNVEMPGAALYSRATGRWLPLSAAYDSVTEFIVQARVMLSGADNIIMYDALVEQEGPTAGETRKAIEQWLPAQGAWLSMSADDIFDLQGIVRSVVVNASSGDVYVSGSFTIESTINGEPSSLVVRWPYESSDGFKALGYGLPLDASLSAAASEASATAGVHGAQLLGASIYFGGQFISTVAGVGGKIVTLSAVAEWRSDLELWQNVADAGSGVSPFDAGSRTVAPPLVMALALHADRYLIAGGRFSLEAEPPAAANRSRDAASGGYYVNLALYDLEERRWHTIGAPVQTPAVADSPMSALASVLAVAVAIGAGDEPWLYVVSAAPSPGGTETVLWRAKSGWLSPSSPSAAAIEFAPLLRMDELTQGTMVTLATNGSASCLWLGGEFGAIGSATVNNVAQLSDAGGSDVLTALQNLAAGVSGGFVASLAYAPRTRRLYAAGDFKDASGATADAVAYWELDAEQWVALRSDQLSNWQGVVYDVAPSFAAPPSTPSSGGSLSSSSSRTLSELLAIVLSVVGGVLVVLVAAVAVFAAWWMRRRRAERRNRYRRLSSLAYMDIPDDGKPRITVDALLADEHIRKIPWTDIDIDQSRRLGFGASGAVYAGVWKAHELDVAVKRVHMVDDQIDVDEFLKECKILSSLAHENILTFHGVSVVNDTLEVALVTELMARGGLDKLLDQRHGDGANLTLGTRMQLALDAARGMRYLHKCQPIILHRDLKLQNILCSADLRAKVCDFGSSSFKPISKQREMTMNVGTVSYTAPECLSGSNYDEKADVFSFGVVLCELFGTEFAYAQPQFRQYMQRTGALVYAVVHSGLRPLIPEHVPASLRQLIIECLDGESELRPAFTEIVARLRRASKTLDNNYIPVPSSSASVLDAQQVAASSSDSDSSSSSPSLASSSSTWADSEDKRS
jgi:Protein tyrosine and serine/threonine kinase